MAGAAWLLARNDLSMAVQLWTTNSVLVRDTVVFAGPLLAAAAVWMAGRERRHHLEDLLRTTPRPPESRRMTMLTATLAWGLLAYVAVGVSIIALTAMRATWGGLFVWPVLVGAVALLAYASVGYALGTYFPGRFTAPLVAIALFMGQVLVGEVLPSVTNTEWVSYFSPIAPLNLSVWYGVQPAIGGQQTLFFSGLALSGLALALLYARRSPYLYALLACGVVIVCAGAAGITRTPNWRRLEPGESVSWKVIPYEPVCARGVPSICVHPAYKSLLSELAAYGARLAAPLEGLPGVPRAAEQSPPSLSGGGGRTSDAIELYLGTYPWSSYNAAYQLAEGLVRGPGDGSGEGNEASAAVEAWLVRQAGLEVDCADNYDVPVDSHFPTPACRAADRFGALTPAERRAWLETHYADLRAGRMGLEELP